MTTFSVVFVYKLFYNAGKNSVKIKEKKQIENKEKRAKQNDKGQSKTSGNLIERLDKT